MNHNSVPLCVDLDGTLIKTDTLHELILKLIKQEPWQLFCLIWVVLQCYSHGKQHLKQYLVNRVSLHPELLPYNHEFLAYLKKCHQQGTVLILVTGCHEKIARKIADHLGIFNHVIATNENLNLTGKNKADKLCQHYGKQNFDYAGNSLVDKVVWEQSREKILVNALPHVKPSLEKKLTFTREFDKRKYSVALLIKALRLHQWSKNALVFLPALTAHLLWKETILSSLIQAFIAFGCCASFSYIINDLLDLDDDRQHHRKKYRPFASGQIQIPTALLIALLLLIAAILLSTLLPWRFTELLILYFVLTNVYSFKIKKFPILDVAMLAGLYTLRVLAGAMAIHTEPTFWLIAFSAFLFFSLAIVKRLSELLHLQKKEAGEVKARGYISEDIITLQGLGSASAIASVLVLALYINSNSVRLLYQSPNQLWLLCPVLLLWLGRVWLITGRGSMHDDPVVFALKDKASWILLVAAAGILISATYF